MKRHVRKVDRRLLGTWKSDRRRTFRHYVPKPGTSPQSLRKLKSLFGKLVVRWGFRRVHTDLDGFEDSSDYEIIAHDSSSVVVECFDSLSQEKRLLQIQFEDNYYWVWAGNLREYFKRVK
jgi:hypothetical protein